MNLEDYLEHLQQSSESMFAMDSFKLPKKKKIIRRGIYPERLGEQAEGGIRRVLIDFDGPLHKYSKGYGDGDLYDEPSEGSKEFIDWLKGKGYQVVIFTTRASKTNADEQGGNYKKEILKIENWLKQYDIYYDLITAEKLHADIYIDDKAIHFNNWKSVKDEVIKRMNL